MEGTIVLDETSELSHSIQSKLLSAIQLPIPKLDIRFISTTNIDIEETLKKNFQRFILSFK